MSAARQRFLPYAALLGAIATLCVGTSLAKGLFPAVGAQGTSAYRVGFAALILVLVWRPWNHPIARADLGRIALYGAVMGLLNLSFYMAIRTIPLGLAVAIEFVGPLVVSVAASRKLIHFVWIGLAVLGLAMLLPIDPGAKPLDPVGVGFACVAGVMWALYIILGKRTGHLHAGRSVAPGMAAAALIVVPIGVASAGTALFQPKLIGLGLVAAVLSSAIPYSLEMIALRAIPKRTFGVMLSLEPAAGALAGLVILHERLVPTQWLAIAAIVAASAGAILTTPPETVIEDAP